MNTNEKFPHAYCTFVLLPVQSKVGLMQIKCHLNFTSWNFLWSGIIPIVLKLGNNLGIDNRKSGALSSFIGGQDMNS